MGRMMALVAQQGGDLDVALEQVRPGCVCLNRGWTKYLCFWFDRLVLIVCTPCMIG
jgi:hypothetical protein